MLSRRRHAAIDREVADQRSEDHRRRRRRNAQGPARKPEGKGEHKAEDGFMGHPAAPGSDLAEEDEVHRRSLDDWLPWKHVERCGQM